ncbi:MAG: hypothetical protein Q7U02_11515, partial [Desulfosalsimonadaceae bacterium]|nr:hypothetical protein [Desulfosalsimonadaceae bacterium]
MMRPEKDKISAFLDRTLLNDFLSVGGDFRFMVLTEEERDKNPIYFPMQADLYFGADLLRHLNVFTQFGMQRGGNPTVREAGAILGYFPFNSYCKIGKFVPPYGHRFEDHTAFIRSEIDFDHSKPETYVTGVEVGSEPLLLFWNLSAYNADATPSQNSEETTARGYSATAGWRGLWLHLGASAINNQKNDIGVDSTTDRTAYGVFGAIRLKKLIYLFEFDRRKDE